MWREDYERMDLQSKDWFFDAEIVIKAEKVKLDLFKLNVYAQMRLDGASIVNSGTVWEFLVNLFKYRYGGPGRTIDINEGGTSHQPTKDWRSNSLVLSR